MIQRYFEVYVIDVDKLGGRDDGRNVDLCGAVEDHLTPAPPSRIRLGT